MRAKLRLESDGFDTGIAGAKRALTGFRAGVDATKAKLNELGESMRSVGRKMTIGLTLPIVSGFGLAVNAASDLGEAQSATDTIFGESSATVQKWAKTTANAYGISNEAALTGVNTLAQVYKGFGVTEDAAAKYGMAIVNASGDLASFKNLNTADVLADLQSGIVGQYEPLLKYGIVLNEASVNQRAMEMTGKANADQLTAGEKVLARQELILEGLGDAQGDAARTANGLANVQRRLRAIGTDLAAKWGRILLPVVLKFGLSMLKVAKALDGVSPKIMKLVIILISVVGALGPVIYLFGLLAPAIAFLLSPIALVAVAIGLLVYAFTRIDGVRTIVSGLADSLQHLWTYMKLALDSGTGVAQLVGFLPDPLKRVGKGFLLIADAVGDVVHAFQNGGFSGLLASLPGELSQIWQGLSQLGSVAIDFVLDTAVSVAGWLWDHKGDIWGGIKTLIGWTTNTFTDAATATIDGAISLAGDLFEASKAPAQWIWNKFFKSGNFIFPVALFRIAGNVDALGFADKARSSLGDALDRVDWAGMWTSISTFFTGLWDSFQNYNYNSLGVRVGEGIRGAIEAVGPRLLEVGGKIIRSLGDGLKGADWLEVLKWVALIPVAIPLAIVGAATVLGPKAAEFMDGLLTGLGLGWDEKIVPWFSELPQMTKELIVDSASWLLVKGEYILTGLFTGLGNYWDSTISPWFTTTLPDAIGGAFDSALTWLVDAGTNILTGLWDGISGVWETDVKPGFAGYIGDILITFSTSLSWLLAAGTNLLTGLWNGISGVWTGTLKPKIGEIISSILTPFAGAGSWLYGVGQSIINGLSNGIESVADAVVGKFQGVIDRIKNIPLIELVIKSPSKFMAAVGKNTMLGLAQGIDMNAGIPISSMFSAIGGLKNSVGIGAASYSGMSSLGSVSSSQLSASPVTINVNINGYNKNKEELAEEVGSVIARKMALMVGM